jgi:hypothetical protein
MNLSSKTRGMFGFPEVCKNARENVFEKKWKSGGFCLHIEASFRHPLIDGFQSAIQSHKKSWCLVFVKHREPMVPSVL